MTTDDWDSANDPFPPDDEGSASDAARPPIPMQLQNWRVVEIDGAAIPTGEDCAQDTQQADEPGDVTAASEAKGPAVRAERSDHIDDVIVLSVPERNVSVVPGEAGTIALTLLNNANRPTVAEVTVAGAASPGWFPELPMRVPLQAGERQSFVVTVTPPVGADAPSGEYSFEIVALVVEQPRRRSRRGMHAHDCAPHGFRAGNVAAGTGYGLMVGAISANVVAYCELEQPHDSLSYPCRGFGTSVPV